MVLFSDVKYLGVVHNAKINWRKNLELSVKRADIAFYCCKRTLLRICCVQPGMIFWIYTAVVYPILTHACTVW